MLLALKLNIYLKFCEVLNYMASAELVLKYWGSIWCLNYDKDKIRWHTEHWDGSLCIWSAL